VANAPSVIAATEFAPEQMLVQKTPQSGPMTVAGEVLAARGCVAWQAKTVSCRGLHQRHVGSLISSPATQKIFIRSPQLLRLLSTRLLLNCHWARSASWGPGCAQKLAACRLLNPRGGGAIAMPEIMEFAVAANNSGLLELVAIARPRPGEELHVSESSEVFSSGVWINQQLPQDAHAHMDGWVDHWRSLGEPGSGNQRSGITLARNPDGRLEAALLNTHTVWHAWQKRPDGNWSSWASLGSPVPGATLSSPTLASDKDGCLELFTTAALLPDMAVWHRRQAEPGQGPWEEWRSLGYPDIEGGSTHAPTLARNKDGRLELFIAPGGEIWHCWQTAANSDDWSQWEPLGTPGAHADVGWPVAARGQDGRLHVLVACGAEIAFRRQSDPGRGPWKPWATPEIIPHPAEGMPELTVAAQADGRLVLFGFRRGLLAAQGAELLEMRRQTVHGEWDLPGDIPQIGHGHNLTIDDPTLAADGDGRLWLFFRIPGHTLMFYLNQTHPNGSEWGESMWNFGPPKPF